MTRPIPVVAYDRDRHEAALTAFTARVLGADVAQRRKRIIDTFHERMPGRDRLPLRHILLDGEVVAGTMGHMPADFLVKGDVVRARFTHDLLVDPEYRGAGLGKLIVAHASGLGDFFPGGMWMTGPCHKIHVTNGFEDAAPLVTQNLVLRPGTFLDRRGLSVAKRTLAIAALTFKRATALRSAHTLVVRGGAVRAVTRFESAHDSAWLALAKGYDVTRLRDAAYLNWKYLSHPVLDYRAFVAGSADAPAGYLIWRPSHAGATEQRGVVADFLVANGDTGTFRALLAHAIRGAHEAGMESLAVLSTQTWARESMTSLGFMPSRNPNTWVVAGWKSLMPAAWLHDPNRWHVVLGDSDGDMWTGSM